MKCCKDCTDRCSACWGTCEKYIEARKLFDKAKAEKAKADMSDSAINAVQYYGHARRRKPKEI